MRVLVTGGSGMLGKNLGMKYKDWVYISSEQFNLEEYHNCLSMIEEYRPDAILHLASRVGGIKNNLENQISFYEVNTKINFNTLKAAKEMKVKRVLSCLSTCAFPELKKYPFSEEDFFDGIPVKSNFSYGITKRNLFLQTKIYRENLNLNYSTFCPSNLYGYYDHFDNENSHFIASLISKLDRVSDGDTLEFWGDGSALRQHLFCEDLTVLMNDLLVKHNTGIPLIVAPKENLSIREIVNQALKISGKDVKVIFNGKYPGQFRKDGDNSRLLKLIGGFNFTSLETGLKKTLEHYRKNK